MACAMCSAAGGFILSRRYLSQGATGRAFAPRCAAERSPLRSELHALESSYKEVPKSNSLIDGTGYEVVDEDPEQPGIPQVRWRQTPAPTIQPLPRHSPTAVHTSQAAAGQSLMAASPSRRQLITGGRHLLTARRRLLPQMRRKNGV